MLVYPDTVKGQGYESNFKVTEGKTELSNC